MGRDAMSVRDVGRVIAATGRVLRDSNRTDDVLLVAEITARRRWGRILDEVRRDPRGRELLRTRPMLGPDELNLPRLRMRQASSLGGAVARHFDDNELEPYVGPVSDEHITDPDARYLLLRFRQMHDIWHVLLGVGAAGHEEVLVHAFTLGHLRLPNSAMIVTLGGLKHLVFERRWDVLWRGVAEAYRAGRDAADLLLVDWIRQLERPLDAVRRDLAVPALRHV